MWLGRTLVSVSCLHDGGGKGGGGGGGGGARPEIRESASSVSYSRSYSKWHGKSCATSNLTIMLDAQNRTQLAGLLEPRPETHCQCSEHSPVHEKPPPPSPVR